MDVKPALMSALEVGNEGSGLVRVIAVDNDPDEAAAFNSDAFFGAFMDNIERLIEGAPQRVLLDLCHGWSR